MSDNPGGGLEMAAIRVARSTDAEACAAIYAPFVTDNWVSMETEPPTPEQMAARITKTLARWPWLVADGDGDVLGYAYASQHRERASYRWSVDVTVYLAPGARGAGLGRRLYGGLFQALEALGYRSAFAGIALPNDASIGLHQAVGFQPIGVYHEVAWKMGAWRDVSWWRRPLSSRNGPPDEPVRYEDL